MEWNHRIVFDNGVWEIREVHYKDGEPVGHCSADLYGETPSELLAQYKMLQEAFQLPILSLTEEDTLVEGASPLELPRRERVNNWTRAPKDGREIVCPKCDEVTRVYHFAWSALVCILCKATVNKNDWETN